MRSLVAITATLAVFGIPAFYYYVPILTDGEHPIHLPSQVCAANSESGVFCEERFFEDGEVRFIRKPSEIPYCCILERLQVSTEMLSYRVLTCDKVRKDPIDCSAVGSYGIYDWIIDGRSLEVDKAWEGHESSFITSGRQKINNPIAENSQMKSSIQIELQEANFMFLQFSELV